MAGGWPNDSGSGGGALAKESTDLSQFERAASNRASRKRERERGKERESERERERERKRERERERERERSRSQHRTASCSSVEPLAIMNSTSLLA